MIGFAIVSASCILRCHARAPELAAVQYGPAEGENARGGRVNKDSADYHHNAEPIWLIAYCPSKSLRPYGASNSLTCYGR